MSKKNKSETTLIQSELLINKLKNEKRNLEYKYKLALKEIENLQKKLSLFQSIKIDNKKIIKIRPLKKNNKSESVAIAVASDWHIEEQVLPDTVNNLNEYNIDIAKNRIRKFFKKVLRNIELYRNITKIDNFVLALLGDFITGYIHDENMENNQVSPLEAIRIVQNEIISGIEFLKKYGDFKKIYVPCAYGNHGRTSKQYKISTAAQNSYEQHMYLSMADYFKSDKSIQFIINNSYFTYLDIYGYLIRFHHGDNIRYKGGIGGPTIPINKAIAQWNKAKSVYLDVFGHMHQFMDGGKFIMNGSLIGFNSFAISIKAPYEEPKQVFFLIEKSRGKTSVSPIFVD